MNTANTSEPSEKIREILRAALKMHFGKAMTVDLIGNTPVLEVGDGGKKTQEFYHCCPRTNRIDSIGYSAVG